MHPKNMGEIKNPDGVGKVGNVVCGDVMFLYIRVKEDKKTKKKIISDIKFSTFGCAAAIGTSSMITELAKGKALEEAMKISRQQIADSVGGLPPIKMHCSVLAEDALSEAIYNYLAKNKLYVPENLKKKHEKIAQELVVAEKTHEHLVHTHK